MSSGGGSQQPLLRVSVDPFRVTSTSHHMTAAVKVSDLGPQPVRFAAKMVTVRSAGGGCATAAAPPWVRVTPASFTVQPGQHATETISVNAPATATNANLIAVFQASPVTALHGIRLSAGVGTRVLLDYGRPVTTATCVRSTPKAAAPPAHTNGFGSTLAGLFVLAALLALVALGVRAIRRRRGRLQ